MGQFGKEAKWILYPFSKYTSLWSTVSYIQKRLEENEIILKQEALFGH